MLFCRKIQNQLFPKIRSGISNRLDPDQARCFVGPDLVPSCQQTTLVGKEIIEEGTEPP